MPLLQTPDFSENSNFILPKKYAHKESYNKSKPTNILSPNRYQLLKPTSENTEYPRTSKILMHYVYLEMKINRNRTQS